MAMSSGNRHFSPEDGSEDSHFSSAARCRDGDEAGAAGSSSRIRRNTTAGKKRKSRHEPEEFDDMEFSFSERNGDANEGSKDDSGGVLGNNLARDLDNIGATGLRGSGGKRRKQRGTQHKAATATRSAPRGRRNAQGRGNGPASSTFLDRAYDIQNTEAGCTSTAVVYGTSESRRTGPASLTATPRRNGSLGKAKPNHGDDWMNTRGSGQAKLTIGSLGRVQTGHGKIPSRTSARSRTRKSQDATISAGAKARKHDVVDMLSDDDDTGLTRMEHTRSQVRASNSKLDHMVGHSTPASDRSTDGVQWGQSDSESEDLGGTGAGDRSPSSLPGKPSSPINVEEEDSNSSQFSIRKVATDVAGSAVGSVAKTARRFFSAGGLKTNRSAKAQRIEPGASLSRGIDDSQEDEIESVSSLSTPTTRGRKKTNPEGRLYEALVEDQERRDSQGRQTADIKSNGVNPASFYGKRSSSSPTRKKNRSTVQSKNSGTASEYGHNRHPRRSARNKKKTNAVICIDDDDSSQESLQSPASEEDYGDEGADMRRAMKNSLEETSGRRLRRMGNRIKVDAVRIAIGKKVFSHGCEFSFQPGTSSPFLRLTYKKESIDNAPTAKKDEEEVHTITPDSIDEFHYFLADKSDEESDVDFSSGSDAMSFLAMRIGPNNTNRLNKFSSAYLQSTEGAKKKDLELKQYIIVELRSDDEFETNMLQALRKSPSLGAFLTEESQLQKGIAKRYIGALLEDDRKDRQSRAASPRKRKTRSTSRTVESKLSLEDNKTILVYPFEADDQVFDHACKDLTEVGGKIIAERSLVDDRNVWRRPQAIEPSLPAGPEPEAAKSTDDNDAAALSSASNAPSGRTHYLTIRNDDMDRLEQGEFLNDTLIDFFMRWIWRKDDPDSSKVHFFTSHFFSTLDDEGPESVSSWTAKKNIDIFKKTFVFIPINESLHWSLCVVVNPGHITNEYADDAEQSPNHDFPCILFLDSLKAHRKKRVANKVCKWLNYEAKRLKKFEQYPEPFTRKTMEVFDPKIPYQDNSWDCGVFVCRYAYALYLMRNKRLTYETCGVEDEPPYFRDLITNSNEFNFGMEDIANVREEMKQLVQNLSKVYLKIKKDEAVERKERKRREKDAQQAKVTTTATTEEASSETNNKKDEAMTSIANDEEEKKASDSDIDFSVAGVLV